MPVIIDENGSREVTQQEYDVYVSSISPTLQKLKEDKIQELENLTRKYISDNIYFEIEKSVRTSNALPEWVNEFVSSITQKNYELKSKINLCLNLEDLKLIDIYNITT